MQMIHYELKTRGKGSQREVNKVKEEKEKEEKDKKEKEKKTIKKKE